MFVFRVKDEGGDSGGMAGEKEKGGRGGEARGYLLDSRKRKLDQVASRATTGLDSLTNRPLQNERTMNEAMIVVDYWRLIAPYYSLTLASRPSPSIPSAQCQRPTKNKVPATRRGWEWQKEGRQKDDQVVGFKKRCGFPYGGDLQRG